MTMQNGNIEAKSAAVPEVLKLLPLPASLFSITTSTSLCSRYCYYQSLTPIATIPPDSATFLQQVFIFFIKFTWSKCHPYWTALYTLERWANKVVISYRSKFFVVLGDVQWCTLTVSLILNFSPVTWKYGSAYQASASTKRNCCAVLPSIMSTIQHQCKDIFTPHVISLVIISVHPFASSRLTCCGSAKNFGQHWLCSLQLFYQSVSSDFVPILISSVLIELSICVLEFLLVHPYRAYWQAWDFPI